MQLIEIDSQSFIYSLSYVLFATMLYLIALGYSGCEYDRGSEIIRLFVNYLAICFLFYSGRITIDLVLISAIILLWYSVLGVKVFNYFLNKSRYFTAKYKRCVILFMYHSVDIIFFIKKTQAEFFSKLIGNMIISGAVWLFIYLWQSLYFNIFLHVLLGSLLILNVVYINICQSNWILLGFHYYLDSKKLKRLAVIILYLAHLEVDIALKDRLSLQSYILEQNIDRMSEIIKPLCTQAIDYIDNTLDESFRTLPPYLLLKDKLKEFEQSGENLFSNKEIDHYITFVKLNQDICYELLHVNVTDLIKYYEGEIKKSILPLMVPFEFNYKNKSANFILVRSPHWYININRPVLSVLGF